MKLIREFMEIKEEQLKLERRTNRLLEMILNNLNVIEEKLNGKNAN